MEKIDIYSKPSLIIEHHRGIYHPDPILSEESYPFTMEVYITPSSEDISLGELIWDDEIAPSIELLAEDKIRENFFDLKWRKNVKLKRT